MKVKGGLGNQLFQYAYGRSLSLQYKSQLLLDLGWYGSSFNPGITRFHLHDFPHLRIPNNIWRPFINIWDGCLVGDEYDPEDVAEYVCLFQQAPVSYAHIWEKSPFRDESGVKREPPAYLDGYWQCENYFAPYAKQIAADLEFPQIAGEAAYVARQMGGYAQTVSVHIRHGDLLANPDLRTTFGVLDADYYARAIDVVCHNVKMPLLVLITDDVEWTKNNFDAHGLPWLLCASSQDDNPIHDLHLMSLCRHHILANSTFSWWGAWLGAEQNFADAMIIAPMRYFANSRHGGWHPAPKRWLRV